MSGGIDDQINQVYKNWQDYLENVKNNKSIEDLKKDLNHWLIEEVLPLDKASKVMIYLDEFPEGEFDLYIEEREDYNDPTLAGRFTCLPETTKEEAEQLLQYLKDTLENLLSIPVLTNWNQELIVDGSNLPKYKLVKYVESYPQGHEFHQGYFKDGEHLILIGEIEQMPGHCIVLSKKGKLDWGYHTSDFVELTEEEV